MNIAELRENIKTSLDRSLREWSLFAILFLIALASFGLGRLSVFEDVRPAVSLKEAPGEALPKALYVGGLIEASRSGSVYYYPWCDGALKIPEQNRIWFADEVTAQKAGLTPAKVCKGLGIE